MTGHPPLAVKEQKRWAFLSPPQAPGELGRLAQYRVLRQLGQGGMGVVFEAEDAQLCRPAALKVMRPELAAGPLAKARFLREARAAAALKHDNVVTIYQVGEDAGVPFLAMEFLAGKTLDEYLRPERKTGVAETLAIGKQIAKGLAAAHAVGLIHRDIKPANLWLETPRGRVKILDFGLARRAEGEAAELTNQGEVVGTPAYMAPEQARGGAVDHRCDLFSLGCVLYRMVSGRLPFRGDSVYAVLSAIATETPPPISSLNPDIPTPLIKLIERLLAKSPDNRPTSAQVVLSELQAIESELKQAQSTPPEPPPPIASSAVVSRHSSSRLYWKIALAALATMVLASLLAFAGRPPKKVSNASRPTSGSAPFISANDSSVSPKAIANAPPVNVTGLIDIGRDVEAGRWIWPQEGRIRNLIPERNADCALVLPWDPPEAYRLKLTTYRIAGEGPLHLGLSSGKHRFMFVLDLRRDDRHFGGIAMPDLRGNKISPRNMRLGKVLTQGLSRQIICTVTPGEPDQLIVSVEGAQDFLWRGDFKSLERTKVAPDEPLFLAVGAGEAFWFEDIVIEPLGPSAGAPLDRGP